MEAGGELAALWELIQDVAEGRLSSHPRPHFLGAIVPDQLKTAGGDIGTRQIIDGLRIMTTFQVVLAARRDRCKAARNAPNPFALHFIIINHIRYRY